MVVMVVMTVVGTGRWWSKVSVLSSSEDHITRAQNHLSFRLLLFDTSKQVFLSFVETDVLGIKDLVRGFDEEAATVVLGRLVSHKIEIEPPSFEPKKWLDQTMGRLFHLFQGHQIEMSRMSESVFYLKRSRLIETRNSTPDETAFFRMLFNRVPVSNAFLMIFPMLVSYVAGEEPKNIPFLDIESSDDLDNTKIFILDSFVRVLILRGSSFAMWSGIERYTWPQALESFLESIEDIGRGLTEEPGQFPVSHLTRTDQGTDEARSLTSEIINPRDTSDFF